MAAEAAGEPVGPAVVALALPEQPLPAWEPAPSAAETARWAGRIACNCCSVFLIDCWLGRLLGPVLVAKGIGRFARQLLCHIRRQIQVGQILVALLQDIARG